MKKHILIILLLLIVVTSCKEEKKENTSAEATQKTEEAKGSATALNGYELMQQKCFICHFEKPDPAKMSQMIAPPILRVQEHYKPTYPKKEDFIKAVMSYVNNPSEDKTLMPGAVKKFNLMPKVVYDQNELRAIVETLYKKDFGDSPKMRKNMKGGLHLNNGKKWKLKPETIDRVAAIKNKLEQFNSDQISDYNELGKEVFDQAKVIMLDKDYSGDLFEQIHFFFGGIEGHIHALIATESVGVAQKQITILINEFNNFNQFFEK